MKYTVESFKEEFCMSPIGIIKLLSQIKQARSDEDFGVCWNLSDLIEEKYGVEEIGYDIVEEFSDGWEYYSGLKMYPIPRTFPIAPLWKGDQLKYRLDLIDYIIGQLKEIK
tara:strand:- start:7645 stop:7977 length:333 start_codon:yes stop_codon:yes gene_type:complete